MIQPICKDMFLLSQKAKDADRSDLQTAADLMDTLKAHRNECVGMAANMIGIPKRIIVFSTGPAVFCMLNPKITAKSEPYDAEEGCLSLSGTRKTTRYRNITVSFQDLSFHTKQQKFNGYTAQIIQHEIDHTNGIII